jgi:hypothetical protein
MHQPGQFAQLFGTQELYFVLCDAIGHHSSIIP